MENPKEWIIAVPAFVLLVVGYVFLVEVVQLVMAKLIVLWIILGGIYLAYKTVKAITQWLMNKQG